MTKQELRQAIRQRLKEISPKAKEWAAEQVKDNFLSLGLDCQSVCVYNAMPSEISTKAILEELMGKIEVYMPVVRGEDMYMVKVDTYSQFEVGAFGISEPIGQLVSAENVNIDVCITPMLGADKQLGRLGKGKGYYDKFFAKVQCTKVGLCYETQIVDDVQSESWDIPMDYVVTEKGIYR